MAVATITHDGQRVEIAYLDEGEGFPILLVHGFASTKEINWVNTGWVRTLVSEGYRVIAHDNRGHGASSKFYDPADYSSARMAGDAAGLLDHLGISAAHLMGYSMGAWISCALAVNHNDRFEKVVLSGNGSNIVQGGIEMADVRDALLAPSLADVTHERGRTFRAFADQTGSDLRALAACAMSRDPIAPADLARLQNPVLVAVGTEDTTVGSGEELAAMIPNARFLPIPGRDHMRAVGDRAHKAGVVEFLAG